MEAVEESAGHKARPRTRMAVHSPEIANQGLETSKELLARRRFARHDILVGKKDVHDWRCMTQGLKNDVKKAGIADIGESNVVGHPRITDEHLCAPTTASIFRRVSGLKIAMCIVHSSMAFRSSFERAYGFDLLDDMHNFFPELMYDDEMFNHEMAAYMRHRVRTLFPSTYTRNENIYNIYERTTRRRNYEAFRATRMVVPPTPRPPMRASRTRVDVDLSGGAAPQLATPPLPPPFGRGRLLGVNTVGGAIRNRNWDWVNMPRQQTMEPIPALTSEENVFTTGLLNLLNISLTGTAAGAFQDVEVAPTPEQIAAGSETRNAETVSSDTICAICMDHGAEEEGTWRILRCSHMYHSECIDTWFSSHVGCPVCRTDIRSYSVNMAESP